MEVIREKSFVIRALLIVFMIVFSSGALYACKKQGANVVVAGSTSMLPYVEKLAYEFNSLNPKKSVDVQGGGSSAGIVAAKEGIADFGMSSRSLKDSESDLWSKRIAKDALVLIIHPDNPIIKKANNPDFIVNLTSGQIRDIYSGKITNWSEVGGNSASIHVVTREEGSGTRSAFEELVMTTDKQLTKITSKAIVQNSNGSVRMLVSDDPNKIGFISLGLVEVEGRKPVKALSIDNVSATEENVLSGNYKLVRSFLFVAKTEPIDTAKDFLDFVLSSEGKKILSDAGLITFSEE